ncbi:MAG: mechanosensitive ion channel family protein, partial [Ramlibacter sp.]
GTNTDPAGMIGLLAKWFIRLVGLVVAFDALGLPAISDVLRELLLWLPNVVVALVVLVIGGLAARALGNLVRGATAEAGISSSGLLAKIAATLVWAFAIVVAVNQIGIATTLVNTLFMAFVGAIALGLGLAFGLGGRETAGQIVSQWYRSAQDKGDQLARAADAGGRIASEQASSMTRSTGGGSTGGGAGGSSGGYSGGSTGGYGGGGETGGGYTGGGNPVGSVGAGTGSAGTGGGYSGGPQYPTDGGPRTGGSGATAPDNQMYPTPSAPRHPSEGF